jgi:uncharacterized membrane protein YuzA (DUF378 family)
MENIQPGNQQPIYKYPPKTWLTESILVTIFCCLPFGIVGIVHASKVEQLFHIGQEEAANRAAAEAKKWTKIGFWIGVGIAGLYLLFYIVYFVFIIGIFAVAASGS